MPRKRRKSYSKRALGTRGGYASSSRPLRRPTTGAIVPAGKAPMGRSSGGLIGKAISGYKFAKAVSETEVFKRLYEQYKSSLGVRINRVDFRIMHNVPETVANINAAPMNLTKSTREGAKNKSAAMPGRAFKSYIKLGSTLGRTMSQLKRSNGSHWRNHSNTLTDALFAGFSLDRRSLNPEFGFNQKYASFHRDDDVPNYVKVYNDGQWTTTTSTGSSSDRKMRCAVIGSRAKHTFTNTSTLLPVNIRVTVFYDEQRTSTWTQWTDKVFGQPSSQGLYAIPSIYCLDATTGTNVNGTFGGRVLVDPATKWSSSPFWRDYARVAATETVKLNPNDVWELKIEEIYKSGIDFTTLKAGATVPGLPMTYMLLIESWGDKCEAVYFNPGTPAERTTYVGTAPGGFARECKIDMHYIPPAEPIRAASGNADVNTFQNADYATIVYRESPSSTNSKIFNRLPAFIGVPGSGGDLYIPVLTEGAVSYTRSNESTP